MTEARPIPIRLSDELIQRLDAVSARMSISRSALIKFCIQTFVDHLEKTGQQVTPEWHRILDAMDGRRNLVISINGHRNAVRVAEKQAGYRRGHQRKKKGGGR